MAMRVLGLKVDEKPVAVCCSQDLPPIQAYVPTHNIIGINCTT